MFWVSIAFAFGFLACYCTVAQLEPNRTATYPILPRLREQASILDKWTAERVERLPDIMAKYNVDAWLMSQREYAEDTAFWSVKPATTFSARRRTVYLFHTRSGKFSQKNNPLTWIDNTPQVWTDLRDTLEAYNPRTIALNIDPDLAFADGMHAGELEMVQKHLGGKWMKRVVREPMLAIEYIATRIPAQLGYYKKLQEMAWAMITGAFSEKTIVPGVTTTDDVVWWFRDKIQAFNVSTWFMPSVTIFRNPSIPASNVIQEGDMLHTDFGITFLGLNTDTQHLGYVLRASQGETDVPEGLKLGLRVSNRMQEIVRSKMEPGKTGNEVLQDCLQTMKREGIEGQVYSHPIGDRGHGPGSLIGMTNLPNGVPILGDLPILPRTYYSIELSAKYFVPEWGVEVNFMQEEDVYWSDETENWEWVWGRQENFHLVRGVNDTVNTFLVQV